ncbi:MAG: hypothetical protein AB4290_26010 [Spirulina sp.]
MNETNQNALEELIWAIEAQANANEFNIFVVRCNSADLRQRLEKRLQSLCELSICSVVLQPPITGLYTRLQEQFAREQPQVLMVSGFENLTNLDSILAGANRIREDFRKNFPIPVIWWANDNVIARIKRVAPDFESWMPTVEFELSDEELIDFIESLSDDIFERFLQRGAVRALDYVNSDLGLSISRRQELLATQQELRDRGIQLDPYLEGSLEFILTLGSPASLADSLLQYERSFALLESCHELCDREQSSESTVPSTEEISADQNPENEWLNLTQNGRFPKRQHSAIVKNIFSQLQRSNIKERYGCLAYCLGVWWRSYGIQTPVYCEPAFEIAKDYFNKTIDIFEKANRLDLAAKFINALGDILERLQEWETLEKIAQKAISLHQNYPNSFRLARAHGLLAASALGQQNFTGAIESAGRAISISAQTPPDSLIPKLKIPNLEWVRSYNQAAYFLILARAKKELGLIREAVDHLELAKTKTDSLYEPQIYIAILQELHNVYCDRKEYLKAYQCKAEKHSVQQQYGLRAFIGAGSLQPSQELCNNFANTICSGKMAREIVASGRDRDIANLVERMSRPDYKLTIIYGQSGVGKSSIIQAGLIPELKQKSIGTRDISIVLHRVYTNWITDLAESLSREITNAQQAETQSLNTDNIGKQHIPKNSQIKVAKIINQLNQNAENNFLTILAFDQFEEFFCVHQKQKERQSFYSFIANCLDVPYTKIIFSLQEKYLFNLLEFTRYKSLNTINNNILDKNILYYLGNFTPKEARSTIAKLTQETYLFLEPELIEELTEDLAGEQGEVRPIELQVVGAQLQAEKITTLAQYRERGPKENLVQRYLETTIEDCGREHQQIAQLVLYLLTDENNSRPLKTRKEIEQGLQSLLHEAEQQIEKLDLVLQIFTESGLVFALPEMSGIRYQLVHDYLVRFIRKQQGEKLLSRLKKSEEQNRLSEARLNRILSLATLGAAAAAIVFGIFSFSLDRTVDKQRQEALKAAVNEIRALTSSSEALFTSDRPFDALLESLRSATKYQNIAKHPDYHLSPATDTHLRTAILTTLQQGTFWVREFNHLDGHKGDIKKVEFSPDGKYLASGSGDRTVKIWDRQGYLIDTLEAHQGRIRDLDFSPTAPLLATTGTDRAIVLWKREDRSFSPIKTLKLPRGFANTLEFAPDGQTFATGDSEGKIAIRTAGGESIRQWQGHETFTWIVRFSPDGQLLVSGDVEGDIAIWRSNGTLVKRFRAHPLRIHDLAFSPDNRHFATTGGDRTLKIWRRDGTLLKTIPLERQSFGLTFSPDGKTLAVASADNRLKLWDLQGRLQTEFVGHNSLVNTVTFSPDGQTLASGSNDRSVKLWKVKREFLQVIPAHQGLIASLMFSPDGTLLASGGDDGRIKLWHPNGTPIETLQANDRQIASVRFSADSQILAAGDRQGYVHFWFRNQEGSFNDRPTRSLKVHEEPTQNIAFSPDGRFFATSGDEVKLWKIDGTLIQTLNAHSAPIASIRFSGDGLLLISTSWDTSSILWEFDRDRLIFKQTLQGHSGEVLDGTFNPDSQIVATAGRDNTIKFWTREGEFLQTLGEEAYAPHTKDLGKMTQLQSSGHADAIFAIRFSPDGQIIASGSYDRSAKLWQSDGSLIVTLQGHGARIRSLDFHPGGSILATAGLDGRIVLWQLNEVGDLDVLLQRGCTWVRYYLETNANLTPRDRQMCNDFFSEQ